MQGPRDIASVVPAMKNAFTETCDTKLKGFSMRYNSVSRTIETSGYRKGGDISVQVRVLPGAQAPVHVWKLSLPVPYCQCGIASQFPASHHEKNGSSTLCLSVPWLFGTCLH